MARSFESMPTEKLPSDPLSSSRGIGVPVAIVVAIVVGIIGAFALGFSSKAGHEDVIETDGTTQ